MATKSQSVFKIYHRASSDIIIIGASSRSSSRVASQIEKLERMFHLAAGQNGLPNVQRMVQAVPQILDSEFVERSVDALRVSGWPKTCSADVETKLHQNPRLILAWRARTTDLVSKSASHFDQTNVKRNKVVYDTKNGEKYYDDVTRTAQKM